MLVGFMSFWLHGRLWISLLIGLLPSRGWFGLIVGSTKLWGILGRGLLRSQCVLRVTVLLKTMERYLRRLAHLQDWFGSKENLPSWKSMIMKVEALNKVLCAYVQLLHNAGALYSYSIECLAALQMLHPELHSQLHPALRTAREWGKSLLVSVRSPMPLSVLLALVTASWCLGWRRSATTLLLAFDGLLRPMEMGLALRSDLSLPCDVSGDNLCATLAIPESKTAIRTVKVQSIMVTDAKRIRLLTYVYGAGTGRTLLCPGGLCGLQRRFTYLKLCLGLASAPWTLSSIRVEFAKQTQNMTHRQ
eukprot:1427421-Amphidinium_carterae.2